MADSPAPLPVSALYSAAGLAGRPGSGATGPRPAEPPPEVAIAQPRAVPTSQPLGMATDPARAVPTDRSQSVPADHSRSVPTDRSQSVPTDPAWAVPADQSQSVPTDRSQSVPTDRSLTMATIYQPPTLPTDRSQPVPPDHSQPVPADHSRSVPADHSQSVPAPQPLAMPADQSQLVPTAQSQSLPADQPPTTPAEQSLAVPSHRPPAVPADQSPTIPADQSPAVPADQSLAVPSDRFPAVPADKSPARLADQSLGTPAVQLPAVPGAVPSSAHCPSGWPDAVSVADTVSLYGHVDSASMYGTAESLLPEDGSSMGSDSEINGSTASARRTDKYGFLGGAQFSSNQQLANSNEPPVYRESAIPVDVARLRELKWLDMLGRWDKWVARRFDKVKLRCRKGIPSSLRARAWQQLSQSKQLMDQNPGKFEELDRQLGDPKWLDIIEKDLHRQFPFHEMFALRGGHGQQDLYRILKAYTIYRPEEGYCQAQAPVAAVLLMHMPAEQAFWCLVQICEKYLPGYYSAGLEAIQLDGEIFFALLRRVSPLAHHHLKKFKIDPILYMTEWFMCIYSRTLPWSTVLRVWDMFFCDGVKVIFKVGLVLLRYTLGSHDKLRNCQGMYETMEKLRNIPVQYLQEDFLVHEVVSLKVTEGLIERENQTQRRRWMENRGELQHKPSRRLYGARAIREEVSRLNPPLSGSPSLLSLTASLASLRRGKDDRKQQHGMRALPPPSPTHSVRSLAFSVGPRPQALPAASSPTLSLRARDRPSPAPLPLRQPLPGPVVSEGLRPSLPSPTSSVATFGEHPNKMPPTKGEKKREKELERQRAKERERQEKERERQEKERERQEKERERRDKKERERERRLLRAQHKKEHKGAKKENGASDGSPTPSTAAEPSNSASVLKDGYF